MEKNIYRNSCVGRNSLAMHWDCQKEPSTDRHCPCNFPQRRDWGEGKYLYMSSNCIYFSYVIILVVLIGDFLVEGKPRSAKLNSHDFYGAYNPCKYNIWPWPTDVKCTYDGGTRYLTADFHIYISEESRAQNSSILHSGRYYRLSRCTTHHNYNYIIRPTV